MKIPLKDKLRLAYILFCQSYDFMGEVEMFPGDKIRFIWDVRTHTAYKRTVFGRKYIEYRLQPITLGDHE